MGSSAKKKREKKKDFQKTKLKVGKAKPKLASATDTSFRSKSIVLNQQLKLTTPSKGEQFSHHVSMLASHSDAQRKDSLSYLTNYLTSKPVDASLPISTSSLIDAICPLLLSGSTGVRAQTLKLFQCIPDEDIANKIEHLNRYARLNLTHISKDVKVSGIDYQAWLLSATGDAVVCCPGGWQRTLSLFMTILGWKEGDLSKWSSNRSAFGADTHSTARLMHVFTDLIRVGLETQDTNSHESLNSFPLWQVEHHFIPTKSNVYAYLNLFGPPRDDDNQILEDRGDRLRVFHDMYYKPIETAVEAAKKEGGELGRAASALSKALVQYGQEIGRGGAASTAA